MVFAPHDLPRTPPDPDRLIRFDGTLNFRDLGGYRTTDRRRVRAGRVYRCDNLSELSDADVARFGALGVRVVHDLRTDLERASHPNRLPMPGPETVVLDSSDVAAANGDGGVNALVELIEAVKAGRTPMPDADVFEDSYVQMAENMGPVLARFLTSLADAERLPAVFHCMAGKDRTGIAAMVLLDVLGVDEATIFDDFLATNIWRAPTRMEVLRPQLAAVNVPIERAVPLFGVTRRSLERARAHIDDVYGGLLTFLRGAGLDDDVPDRLKALLLE